MKAKRYSWDRAGSGIAGFGTKAQAPRIPIIAVETATFRIICFCSFAVSKAVLEPGLEAVGFAVQAGIGNAPTVYEFESNVGHRHRAPNDVSMNSADRAIVGQANNGRVVVEHVTAVKHRRTHSLGPPMLIGGKRTECGLRAEQVCAVERGAGSNPVVQIATYPGTAVDLTVHLVFAERVDLPGKTEAITKVLGVRVSLDLAGKRAESHMAPGLISEELSCKIWHLIKRVLRTIDTQLSIEYDHPEIT